MRVWIWRIPPTSPQYDKPGFLEMGVSPCRLPDKPTYVTLDFEKGVPVAIDGEKMKASDIIRKLNKLGGENGIGIIDIVENRLVGMKDRGVYETPGGTILYYAHEQLEMLCVDKDTLHKKQKLSVDFADLIYNGKWFTPCGRPPVRLCGEDPGVRHRHREAEALQGQHHPAGTTSPYTLYSEQLATFDESDYDQKDAQGFINLWGKNEGASMDLGLTRRFKTAGKATARYSRRESSP